MITERLKQMVLKEEFLLTQPVAPMPSERSQRPLEVCSKEEVL